jgi:hypothetical protein
MAGERRLCAECDQAIDGDTVWYRPFGRLEWQDERTAQFVAQASAEPLPNGLPMHPACFRNRTGMEWPPQE